MSIDDDHFNHIHRSEMSSVCHVRIPKGVAGTRRLITRSRVIGTKTDHIIAVLDTECGNTLPLMLSVAQRYSDSLSDTTGGISFRN